MTLRIHLFGPLRARDSEQALKLPPRSKLVSLWAYLLVQRGRATPRTLLAYSFWPDDSAAEARLLLRRHLHRLLRLLPAPQAGRPRILSDHSTLQWNPQADAWLDLAEFERLCRQPDGAAEAVALYAGDLLEGLYDDWLLAERERLRDLCFVALHAVVEQLQAAGDGQQAILYAQRLLRLDPLREDTYRTLMRLHARSSDRAGVVRHYNACVTVLQRELGVEPSAETGRAYRDGLAGPPAVEAPEAPPGSAASRHNLPAHLTSFVGRERELDEVRSLLAAARLLTLTGIGGVGKTRLALAAAHCAREALADGV